MTIIWFSAIFLLLVVILATLFKVLLSAPRITILLVPYPIIMIIVAFANFELYRMNPLA